VGPLPSAGLDSQVGEKKNTPKRAKQGKSEREGKKLWAPKTEMKIKAEEKQRGVSRYGYASRKRLAPTQNPRLGYREKTS